MCEKLLLAQPQSDSCFTTDEPEASVFHVNREVGGTTGKNDCTATVGDGTADAESTVKEVVRVLDLLVWR